MTTATYEMLDHNCLMEMMARVARERVYRRLLLEEGTARIGPPSQEEFWQLVGGEIEPFQARLYVLGNPQEALRIWVNQPNVEGWPPCATPSAPFGNGGYDEFRVQLTRKRGEVRVLRMAANPVVARWRADHPEWSPYMSEEEEDAWELDRGLPKRDG